MIINVDKEGSEFMVKLVDAMLKQTGLQGLNFANIILANSKYLKELDVPAPGSPQRPEEITEGNMKVIRD